MLATLDRDQLEEVILQIYEARKDAREFLEYFVNPDEHAMYEKYHSIITKEFRPSRGRPKARTSVCKKAVKDFTLLHPDDRLITDMQLYVVESIVLYANKMRGYIRESHINTAKYMLDQNLKLTFAVDMMSEYMPRIKSIILTAEGIKRCNLGIELKDTLNQFATTYKVGFDF